MAINLRDTVQIIRGKKADIAARTGANGELNWADDTYELYIHDGKTRGGHLIGKASGTAGVVGGAGIAVSTSDGISTVSIKRDPSSVLYATTDGAGVRLGNSGGLQVTAQNALDLHLAEGGGLVVDSNGLKVDSSVLTSVFRYAGQVNSADDLPDDASIGDVYDVKDSGANYVWTGSSWDNLGGILSVDPSPTQGSTNPVASGGVYDAIQDTKLNGDGTTVTVVDNTITAKDIAIGGDTSDLASARGQIGDAKQLTDPNFNTLSIPGIYHTTGTPTNGPVGISGASIGVLVVSGMQGSGNRLFQTMISENGIFWRISITAGSSWKNWNQILTGNKIGDGITVNNGIISVPEYEGATADTAATSGLVPPAAAGDQNKYLGGDGQWHEIVAPSEITLSDSVTSTSSTTAASSMAVKTAYDKAVEAASAASSAQSAAAAASTAASQASTAATNAQSTANSALSTANAAASTAANASRLVEGVCITRRTTLPNYGTWLCGVKIRETVSFIQMSGGSYPINNTGDQCMAVRIA